MKQLDRLLFEQGGDCFFCKKPLAKADASIEHLFAQANGGTNAEENLVACCKALNALLSNKPLKEKFQVVLRQRGAFRCPVENTRAAPVPLPTSSAQPTAQPKRPEGPKQVVSLSVATPAAPRKLTRVSATKPAPVQQIHGHRSAVVCPTCKDAVPTALGQIDYVCQHCGGAFRY